MASSTTRVRFTAEDRRQQILSRATELFADQGYEGTTTRQIAQRANVNEAIIFRHFPSKQELYWEVIERKCREAQTRTMFEGRLEEGGRHQDVFRDIAENYLRSREKDPSLGRLLLYSGLENHELAQRFFRSHITSFYEGMARYIVREIEAGRFRPVDPLLAARAFVGMLIYHYQVQELFGGKLYQDLKIEHVSETITDIWLNGMLPRNSSQITCGSDQSANAQTEK